MSNRNKLIVLALATLAVPAVLAQTPYEYVGGEAGWILRPLQSPLTRDQVRSEFLQFRGNPVAQDGGRYVGGEEGYAFPAHTYAYVNGEWVCTDKIAHNPAPPNVLSPGEKKSFQQRYPS